MRARNIKPGFYADKKLLKCSIGAHFLFPALWMLADREGRLKDDPEQIEVDAYLMVRNLEAEPLLAELAARGLILRFCVDGKKYIQINNFLKHQKPHPNEKPSDIPEPDIKLHDRSCNGASTPADSLNADVMNDEESPTDSCPEPQDAPGQEPVMGIPLIDRSEFEITQNDISGWAESYPALGEAGVVQCLRNMREWCISNPANRKTRRGARRFITNWLQKDQDKARPVRGISQQLSIHGQRQAQACANALEGINWDE